MDRGRGRRFVFTTLHIESPLHYHGMIKRCIADHSSLITGTMVETIHLVERHIDLLIDVIVLLHETTAIEVPDMAAVLHVKTIMLQEVAVTKVVQDLDHRDVDQGVQL